jgi:CHAT domain-containing protein
VIGSLWPVENEATTDLMGSFHKALAETRNPAVALRRAQSEMIAKKQPLVRWAAFQLTGIPGDLRAK